jgi:hypothetical protein
MCHTQGVMAALTSFQPTPASAGGHRLVDRAALRLCHAERGRPARESPFARHFLRRALQRSGGQSCAATLSARAAGTWRMARPWARERFPPPLPSPPRLRRAELFAGRRTGRSATSSTSPGGQSCAATLSARAAGTWRMAHPRTHEQFPWPPCRTGRRPSAAGVRAFSCRQTISCRLRRSPALASRPPSSIVYFRPVLQAPSGQIRPNPTIEKYASIPFPSRRPETQANPMRSVIQNAGTLPSPGEWD